MDISTPKANQISLGKKNIHDSPYNTETSPGTSNHQKHTN